MKKVMVLGGGLLQSFVIKKINEMGLDSVCVDKDENAMAFSLSNYYKKIDIVDEENCLKYAKELKIDAVLTAATDYGVLTASYIAEKMGLCSLDYKTANIIKNKYKTRLLLNSGKWQFFEITDSNDIKNISKGLKYPVMVKPCDGSGSKGVAKAENFYELVTAYENAIKNSLSKKVLIESFIKGKEYGAESLVSGGKVNILAIMRKKMTEPPIYAELGHCVPSGLDKITEEKIKICIEKAVKDLGINSGSVNMDFILSDDSEVYIIDIGARMGGNLIGSHIVPLSTGIDYIAAIINTALYNKADITPKKEKTAVATRILDLKPGIVKKMPNLKPLFQDSNVYDIVMKIKEGSEIKKYISNTEGCGYIVCTGENAVGTADNVYNFLKDNIIY